MPRSRRYKAKENLKAHDGAAEEEDYYDYYDDNQKNNRKGYSPYYRGLLANTSPSIPADQTHYAVPSSPDAFSSSSFASTIFIRVQEALGNSCFQSKTSSSSTTKKESEKNNDDDDDYQNDPVVPPNSTAEDSSRSSVGVVDVVVDRPSPLLSIMESRGIDNGGGDQIKKPLRESYEGGRPGEPPLSNEAKRVFEWADKYRPKALEHFICNQNKANELHLLAKRGECGHFIFQGPAGAGKRTMIWAMLRELFGHDSLHQASEEFRVFSLQGEEVGSIKVLVKNCPRLLEINISDIKGYEKHVIYELIMEGVSHKNPSLPCKPLPDNCRVDKLSSDAILYIKWLLERYNVCNKIFFCCSDASKLQALKTTCTVVQLLPPSRTEIIKVLKLIADKEEIDLPDKLAEKITDASKKNLRQAIRSFEATWLKHYPFTEDQVILNGWEDDIANIAKNMIEEQGPKLLYIIRGKLQNLVEHDVSPELIFQSLAEEVMKRLDDETFKSRVHNLYAEYSRIDESYLESSKGPAHTRKSTNAQQYMRIEEFIAKFMSYYKTEATKIMQQENES
ncbi:hypothetical protein G4B88_021836, partial [Cannabis sativa]